MSFDKPTYVSHSTCADLQADVSGLYGQGAVACWLLALGSVVISWTFNRDCRVRDEITNDLVAAIAIPCVSAGHLIYQMIRRPFWIAIETDQSLVFEIHKNWAGIRASHHVCAIFALWSLLLMIIANSRLHYRQQLVIGSVALLCLTAETVTIWRFYYYSGTKLLLVLQYTTALMTICPVLWTASQLYTDIRAAKLKAISAGPAAIQQTDTIDLELMVRPTALPSALSDAHLNDSHSQSHAAANNPDDQPEEPTLQSSSLSRAKNFTHSATICARIEPLIWGGIGANILFAIHGTYIISDLRDCSMEWPLLIGMSNAKLGDLDQAVALAMGLCTLLYSAREAWKSQRARV
ncbi:hypothetical protein Q7P36_002279 [Cladosporium allicinum]